jgi:hypothetical protein
MKPTKTERLKQEAEVRVLQKSKREQEDFLAWAVEKFDLDFSPPYLPQEEKILLDYYPRRWPTLLKVYPTWEYLPEMERTNAVLVIKFNLSIKLSLKDSPAIQKAISETFKKKGESSELFDPDLHKFKKN